MILYHGSNIKITEVDLSKSKPYKDFGQGFYLSDNEVQAREMANFKSEIFGGNSVISKFQFEKEALLKSDLNIKIFEGYSLEWVNFIIDNRTGKNNTQFDYVYGPIANDKVGRQLRRFFDSDINKEELLERLKFMKGITFQHYFGTDKALQFLKSIE